MTMPRETFTLLNRLSGPDLLIHPERCVLVRHKNADCLKCAEACTSGAISANEDGLAVDPDKCIGCGTCASVCPTCALEPAAPDDQILAKSAAAVVKDTQGCVTFACSNALEDAGKKKVPGCVEVACLGRIEPTELIELAARGALRVFMAHGDCDTCPHASGRSVAEYSADEARDLLEAFGLEMAIDFCDDVPVLEPAAQETPEGASKVRSFTLKHLAKLEATPRELIDAASDIVAEREGFEDGLYCQPKPKEEDETTANDDASEEEESPQKLPHVAKDGALPQFVPVRRTRLFNCLKALGEPVLETLQTGLWGTVSIDPDRCDSCRMCAVFCPTGALRRHDGEGDDFGVTHQATFCVQCGTCEAICPQGAITVSPETNLANFMRGQKELLAMKRPDWEPNQYDSIFKKMIGLLGSENNLAVY
ncbi:MAG: 4Fe-4S binding protein [Coriobacteriales bacterium]|nr:4Fe-4S binding protein [Coriobacteriales bacterium]